MSVETTQLGRFIERIRKEYPEFLSTSDLIRLNIIPSRFAACRSLQRGTMPPSIRIGERKILFPRELLLSWLVEKLSARNDKQAVCDEIKA